MKPKLKKIFALLLSTTTGAASAETELRTHVIQKGEVLSAILYHYGLKPLYGKSGVVIKTVSLNPALLKSHGNHIKTGQRIFIPFPVPENNQELKVTESDAGEVTSSIVQLSSAPTINYDYASPVSEPSYPHSTLGGSVSFGYFRQDIHDRESGKSLVVLSNLTPSLDFTYGVNVSPDLSFSGSFIISQYSAKDLNLDYKFEKQAGALMGAGLRACFSCSKRLRFSLWSGIKDELFIRNTGPKVFRFYPIQVPQSSLNASYDFLKSGRFSFYLGGKFDYLGSTAGGDFKISSGQTYGAFLGFREDLERGKDSQFGLKLLYESGEQNSSFARQQTKRLLMTLNAEWGN